MRKIIMPIIDVMFVIFTYPSAFLLKLIRRAGVNRMPLCKNALFKVGVFPILDHYYEPQFDNRKNQIDFSQERNLPGIDWRVSDQLKMLKTLTFSGELTGILQGKTKENPLEFHLDNGSFESGDAECWYQIIRANKPKRIIEIGSGNSTLMAIKAIKKNQSEQLNYTCEHICIEPYEMPWLEQMDITIIREKVEEIDLSFFSQLKENDILFIDSSHVIRPQGDVLFEYLELLPSLNKGVIVHIHDIFSPRNYPKSWLQDDIRFWNEQYLVEAFLSNNDSWEIIASLNFLHHNYYNLLKEVAPFLTPEREPGSFYIKKIN
jgi:hypothetical protein